MSRQTKLITVTGATGFVGRALVRRLLQEPNVSIRCLVRPSSNRSTLSSLGPNISFCIGDITQPQTLDAAMEGAWGVINLAGYREFWARDRSHFYKVKHVSRQGLRKSFKSARLSLMVFPIRYLLRNRLLPASTPASMAVQNTWETRRE
jgi:uncharacterized protein YbjT (DUF2867 family)